MDVDIYNSRQLYDYKWRLNSPLPEFAIKYMKTVLMNGTTPGSPHACHPSEWIQNEIFSKWFPLSSNLKKKSRKMRTSYLTTGRALFTHKKHRGH
jgi:hypothetical protein